LHTTFLRGANPRVHDPTEAVIVVRLHPFLDVGYTRDGRSVTGSSKSIL